MTANFTATYKLNVTVVGAGHVVPSANIRYPEGTVKTLTAYPKYGYNFLNWSGDLSGTENPAKVTMDNDMDIIANFSSPTGIDDLENKDFGLHNYPNPFSSNTTIKFTLVNESKVKLSVLNAIGQDVNILMNRVCQPGNNIIEWNGTDSAGNALPNGFYICRLQVDNNEIEVNEMVINK